MKSKALMLIGTTIASVSVAAVAAVAIPAQTTLRPASAHAALTAALVTTTIKVTTFNSSFHLNPKTAPRGVVIFKVRNTNMYHHDFSIKGRTTPILSTGQSATLRVVFLRPGRYPYKCTLRSHAGWGQKGVFTIT